MSIPVFTLDGFFFLQDRKIWSKISDLKWAYSGGKMLESKLDSDTLIFRVTKRRENNHVMRCYAYVITSRGWYNWFIKNAGIF